MAIKFEKIQAGAALYRKTSYRNNMGRTVRGWDVVYIRSVDTETRTGVVGVNGRTEKWPEYRLTRLSAKKPETKP